MSNIEKLKRYQAWRSGEDERVMVDAIDFNISYAINGVIEEHVEMYEMLSSLLKEYPVTLAHNKDIEKLLENVRGFKEQSDCTSECQK